MIESSIPQKQVFSHGIVEEKRFKRTLTAVINGKTVPQAVREGLVVPDKGRQEEQEEEGPDDGESLFLPEKKTIGATEQTSANSFAKAATPAFNPQAAAFTPGSGLFQQPQAMTVSQAEPSANPFAKPSSTFMTPTQPAQGYVNPLAKPMSAFQTTAQPKVDSPTTAGKSPNPFSKSNSIAFTPQSTPPKPISQPFVFGGGFNLPTTVAPVNTAAPTAPTPFSFSTSQPISTSAEVAQPHAFSIYLQGQDAQNTGTLSTISFFYSYMEANRMSIHGSISCLSSATSDLVVARQFSSSSNSSLAPTT